MVNATSNSESNASSNAIKVMKVIK